MSAPKTAVSGPRVDMSFAHAWEAEILPGRPMILPPRHFVYPREVEEVERGALEVMVRPSAPAGAKALTPHGGLPSARLKSCPVTRHQAEGLIEQAAHPGADAERSGGSPDSRPFLATCAVGFRDPVAPAGVWAAPNPVEICVVSGGYSYVIDTTAPERFKFVALRPVLQIWPAVEAGLLLFVGHRTILAWSAAGEAWQSEKLSDEGVTVTGVEGEVLHGRGWNMMTDRETPFALDLRTGCRAE